MLMPPSLWSFIRHSQLLVRGQQVGFIDVTLPESFGGDHGSDVKSNGASCGAVDDVVEASDLLWGKGLWCATSFRRKPKPHGKPTTVTSY